MAGHDMFLREGTIDVPTLRRAARRVPVTLLEIRADVPPHDASAPHAAAPGALPVYWKDLLWQPDSRDFADLNLLRDRLARLGHAPGGLIVVYGEHRQYGFYARWALRHAGLPRVFVLERPDLLEQALPVPPSAAGRLIVEPAPAWSLSSCRKDWATSTCDSTTARGPNGAVR